LQKTIKSNQPLPTTLAKLPATLAKSFSLWQSLQKFLRQNTNPCPHQEFAPSVAAEKLVRTRQSIYRGRLKASTVRSKSFVRTNGLNGRDAITERVCGFINFINGNVFDLIPPIAAKILLQKKTPKVFFNLWSFFCKRSCEKRELRLLICPSLLVLKILNFSGVLFAVSQSIFDAFNKVKHHGNHHQC
jgi:hypothetical protein